MNHAHNTRVTYAKCFHFNGLSDQPFGSRSLKLSTQLKNALVNLLYPTLLAVKAFKNYCT